MDEEAGAMKQHEEGNGSRTNRRRLAEALRAFSNEVITCNASDATLEEAAERIEGLSKTLAGQPRRHRSGAAGQGIYAEKGMALDLNEWRDFNPVSGSCNPVAPPMSLCAHDNTVVEARQLPRPVRGRTRAGARGHCRCRSW